MAALTKDKLKASRQAQKASGMSNAQILEQGAKDRGVTNYNTSYSKPVTAPAQTTQKSTSSSYSYIPGSTLEESTAAYQAMNPISQKDIYQAEIDRINPEDIKKDVEKTYDTEAYQNLMDYYNTVLPGQYGDQKNESLALEDKIQQGYNDLFAGQKTQAASNLAANQQIIDSMTAQAQQLLEIQKQTNKEEYENSLAELQANYQDAIDAGEDAYEAEKTALTEYMISRGWTGGGKEIVERTDAAQKFAEAQQKTRAQQARDEAKLNTEYRAAVANIDAEANNLLEMKKINYLQAQQNYEAALAQIDEKQFGTQADYQRAVRSIQDDYLAKMEQIASEVKNIEYNRDQQIIDTVYQETARQRAEAKDLASMTYEDKQASQQAEIMKGILPGYTEAQQAAAEAAQNAAMREYIDKQWDVADKLSSQTGYLYMVDTSTGEIVPTDQATLDREKMMWDNAKSSSSGEGGGTRTVLGDTTTDNLGGLSSWEQEIVNTILSPDYEGGLDSMTDIAGIVAKLIPSDKSNAWEIDQSAQRIWKAVNAARNKNETDQEIELLNQEANRKGVPEVDLTKDPLSEAQRIQNSPEPPGIFSSWQNIPVIGGVLESAIEKAKSNTSKYGLLGKLFGF